MLFFALEFAVFFVIVYAVYWLGPRRPGARLNFLLAASYFFYMAWSVKCLSLLLIVTAADYFIAKKIHASPDRSSRKRLLALSVVCNLGLLAVFKYTNFFIGSAGELTRWLGSSWTPPKLDIVLPIGISFYTFESLSYTIDIYRGACAPARSLRDYAFFVSYFPHLIAGPILRARDFLPQLDRLPSFSEENLLAGLDLFVLGLIKKRLVADTLSLSVDAYFLSPGKYDGLTSWAAVLAYTVQIYCDFSGYSDMARGLGRMFGFDIPVNFRAPYLSLNISEFWQRWHVTLSTWLRDYLYIPLGGNRGGRWLTLRNLMITMLLGGLWHGASWTFVAWGAYHGLLLALFWSCHDRAAKNGPAGGFWSRQASRLLTFLCVCVGWVFFRAQTLSSAGVVLGKMSGLLPGGERTFSSHDLASFRVFLLIGLVFLYDAACRLLEKRPGLAPSLPSPSIVRAAGYAGVLAVLLVFARGSSPFIYFQF